MARWLSSGGIYSALMVGLAVWYGAGGRGVALLFVFLISSSLLTPGGGGRRPIQVWANGGVAALCGAVSRHADPHILLGMAGAIAAATADTWSTEIGGRSRLRPRLITTWRLVEPGMSGGVTILGSLGGIGGALIIALAGRLTGFLDPREMLWVFFGGVAGGLADSFLGATLQVRYRCPACGAVIEGPMHRCGVLAPRISGLRFLNNDAVNFFGTLTGAVVAALPWLPAILHGAR